MISSEVIQLARMLEIKAKQKSSAARSGGFLSAFRGEGVEFRDLRSYEAGDDVRRIDWGASARIGSTQLRTYNEDKNINLFIVIDISSSMSFGSQEKTKLDLAIETAALLLFMGSINRHKTTLIAFSEGIDLFLPIKQGERGVIQAVGRLLNLEKSRRKTNYSNSLYTIEKLVKNRSVVCMLSDFMGFDGEENLRRLKSRMSWYFFRFVDDFEASLPIRLLKMRLLVNELEKKHATIINANKLTKVNFAIEELYPLESIKVLSSSFKLLDILHFFNKNRKY